MNTTINPRMSVCFTRSINEPGRYYIAIVIDPNIVLNIDNTSEQKTVSEIIERGAQVIAHSYYPAGFCEFHAWKDNQNNYWLSHSQFDADPINSIAYQAF